MHRNHKMKDIEELAEVLTSLRVQNGHSKIVQCHGVFDPLHIGHIRHFEQAKKLGDILVVTVTPDRYVNKGPHRPVFTQDLRAEAIAALSCVDYVAVNQWPTAVESIHLLKPSFYVKGQDYVDTQQDRTGGITLEEAAVNAMGGKIAFTNDITFSASNLVNRHMSVFPREVTDYLVDFTSRHTIDEVIGYLDRLQDLKVLVVGETIIDEYQYCQAIGKSSKEPMLALKYLSQERFAGGILAVANHVANFCGEVGLVTFLGSQSSHEEFVREHMNPKVDGTFFYRKDSPTIVKRRFIEEYSFTKLLEVYEMNDGVLDPGDERDLCAVLEERIPIYDLVIVVDFGHGMLSKKAIDILCDKAKFLAVNSQANASNFGYHTISKYPRADLVCTAEGEMRLEMRDRHCDLKEIVPDVAQRLQCPSVVVTRGKGGCLCYSREEGFFKTPAFAGQVLDRMGAGDAFLSVTAPCLVVGTPMEVLGFIGNAVGAQAVATVGHRSSIERIPLIQHIQSLMK
jgi:rfaE bifunctional protein nucleotidyltransferase chain/domain